VTEEAVATGVAEAPAHASDEDYARGYSEGYREGIWESLREVLGHIARGYSASELRILIEGRLARLDDEVDVKRRSLLSPPKRRTWSPRLFPVSAPAASPLPPAATAEIRPAATAPSLDSALAEWSAGRTYLFREERPSQATRFVLALADRHPTVVWVSVANPLPTGVLPERAKYVRPTPRGAASPGSVGAGDPGAVAGRIYEAMEREGGALVYVDALAFFGTEYGLEVTWKFVNWLVERAQQTRSTLVVSHDPQTWAKADIAQLQRSFQVVV
jgi:hypothetical protein